MYPDVYIQIDLIVHAVAYLEFEHVRRIHYVAPCTTRLFFYDDVLYISGVKGGWSVDNTIVANKKTILGISYGDKANVLTGCWNLRRFRL